MLRVRVCAAHMGGFRGPKFSKIFLKRACVIQKSAKNSQKWVVFHKFITIEGVTANLDN